jgi:hypothetical protein
MDRRRVDGTTVMLCAHACLFSDADDADSGNLAVNVGDMSATWRNVAYFRPDKSNLATSFLVCRHTFVS